MVFRKMHFTRGATINCGNYNNIRIEFSAEVEVPEGEDPEACFEKLRDYVTAKVKAEVARNGKA